MNHHVDLWLQMEKHNWLFPHSTHELYKVIMTHMFWLHCFEQCGNTCWTNLMFVCKWKLMMRRNTKTHAVMILFNKAKHSTVCCQAHEIPRLSANMSWRWMKCVSRWFLTSESLLISLNTFSHTQENLYTTCTHVIGEWLNNPQKWRNKFL